MPQTSEVGQRIIPLLGIFNLYTQVLFVPTILFRQIRGMFEKARLTTHPDRRVEIERQLVEFVRARRLILDKCIKT